MQQSIMDFAQTISNTVADKYIVMSRKAACFLRFLARHGLLTFNGDVYTDRILDIDLEDFANQNVIIIDDVIVSGTTLYNVINTLKKANPKSIKAYVLGVNADYFCRDLFEYNNDDGETSNYIQSP